MSPDGDQRLLDDGLPRDSVSDDDSLVHLVHRSDRAVTLEEVRGQTSAVRPFQSGALGYSHQPLRRHLRYLHLHLVALPVKATDHMAEHELRWACHGDCHSTGSVGLVLEGPYEIHGCGNEDCEVGGLVLLIIRSTILLGLLGY